MDILGIIFIIIPALVGLAVGISRAKKENSFFMKSFHILVGFLIGAFIGVTGVFIGLEQVKISTEKYLNSTCQECHEKLDSDDLFCPSCGIERRSCEGCGNVVGVSDLFCGKCGGILKNEE